MSAVTPSFITVKISPSLAPCCQTSSVKFDGMPPFPETHRYVAKVMDLVEANQGD